MGFKSKLINLKDCAVNSMIYDAYYNKDIDENLVYLESRDGLDFTGNIFRIVEELSTGQYGELKIYVHAKPHIVDRIRAYQENYDLKIDRIITKEAMATRVLERAKYIFTDAGIRPKYVKREGQVFVNTWHGTPLKLMGRYNSSEEHRLANAQHPLLSSDYLLYPSHYMRSVMLKSFMIDRIYPGKLLYEGYPRNAVFFTKSWLREKLGLEDNEIFVYMPTFRGVLSDRDDEAQKNDVEDYLSQIDLKLKDNQILYAKLHVLNASQIDFDKFSHIMPFPEGYETYDVLNMADALITDYSSVFFDFANTSRKIILFNYDEEGYESYRGFYFPLSQLPFPKVQTVDELIDELNSPIGYSDERFMRKFCRYDNSEAVKRFCRHIFTNEKPSKEDTIKNCKENILIYSGSMERANEYNALMSLLGSVDTESYNFILAYRQWDENIEVNHREIFKALPEGISVLAIRFPLTPTIREKMEYDRYHGNADGKMTGALKGLYERSFKKQFPSLEWNMIIDFDGMDHDETLMLTSNEFNHRIWVHRDMTKELEVNGSIERGILKEIYSNNNICTTSEELIRPTSEISGRKDNMCVVHNVNDCNATYAWAKKNFKLNPEAIVRNNEIECVLEKNEFKFISIGEYSPEKGYDRLIWAFSEFSKDYPNSQLIIIGQDLGGYEEICRLADESEYSQNITLMKNVYNHIGILKECDLYILSSYYDSWPMILMQADTLCIPTIAVDIPAVRAMGEYSSRIVEDSKDGILGGMHDFVKGDINCANSNFEDYNRNALEEFYGMLNIK